MQCNDTVFRIGAQLLAYTKDNDIIGRTTGTATFSKIERKSVDMGVAVNGG